MNDYYHTIKGQDPERGVYFISFGGWDEIMSEIERLKLCLASMPRCEVMAIRHVDRNVFNDWAIEFQDILSPVPLSSVGDTHTGEET